MSGSQETVVLQNWQKLKPPKNDMCDFALKNKTVAHTCLPSFENGNGRVCEETLLRSRNFATMVK